MCAVSVSQGTWVVGLRVNGWNGWGWNAAVAGSHVEEQMGCYA